MADTSAFTLRNRAFEGLRPFIITDAATPCETAGHGQITGARLDGPRARPLAHYHRSSPL